jgi:hypothetical protein
MNWSTAGTLKSGAGGRNATVAEDDTFGFLTHKVGPLPVWAWSAGAVGVYYWYTHYGPGAAKTASSNAAQEQQVIRDQFVSTPMYGGSKYKTNAEWEDAALNYLVGESVPPDQASNALYAYLNSQPLTAQEQSDVNLAIEGIGPPPEIPAPAVVKPKDKDKHKKDKHKK